MERSIDYILLFAMPVVSQSWSDSTELDRKLQRLVFGTREKEGGGENRSNVVGWQPDHTFLARDEPALNEPPRRIISYISQGSKTSEGADKTPTDQPPAEWSLYGWANVKPRGYYNWAISTQIRSGRDVTMFVQFQTAIPGR